MATNKDEPVINLTDPVLEFGDRLRVLRRHLDLDQKEMAEALGVTPSALGNWETRRGNPRYKELIRCPRQTKCRQCRYLATMKKMLATLALAATLSACGAGAATPAFQHPKDAVEVEKGVWAKDGMLYGENCDRVQALTKKGQKYGPVRNADGSAVIGFGYVCPS